MLPLLYDSRSVSLSRKLVALRQEVGWRMNTPLAEQHLWYSSVLRGHYGYFGCRITGVL
jgi:hypothetical protein